MKYVCGVILMLTGLGLGNAAEQRVLLVLGDSLSAAFGIPSRDGWVALLEQRLVREAPSWKVVNASISGDTTAGGLARLPRLLESHRPHIVILELGSNDGLRGFGFEQIRSNLERMIGLVRKAGGVPLLVGGRLPPNYGDAYADAFHALFHEVAERQHAPLLPFLLQGVAEDLTLMQADGYHPAAAAQPKLLANVWPLLQPLLSASGAPPPGQSR